MATVADKIAKVAIAADKTVVAATAVDKVVAKATKSHTLQSHSATNLNLSAAHTLWMSSKLAGTDHSMATIEVGGAKNAALPILAATLLTDETVVLKNVPDLSDMRFMIEILQHVGAETVQPEPGTWEITAKEITHIAPV